MPCETQDKKGVCIVAYFNDQDNTRSGRHDSWTIHEEAAASTADAPENRETPPTANTTANAVTANESAAVGMGMASQGQICWFQHAETAKRSNGKPGWYKNPWPSFWERVPSGARICSRCYFTALRQRAKGLTPSIPHKKAAERTDTIFATDQCKKSNKNDGCLQ